MKPEEIEAVLNKMDDDNCGGCPVKYCSKAYICAKNLINYLLEDDELYTDTEWITIVYLYHNVSIVKKGKIPESELVKEFGSQYWCKQYKKLQ